MKPLALTLLLVAGCSREVVPPDEGWPGDDLPLCDTDRRAFRIDEIVLPLSSSEAEDFGLDLDGDRTVDNQGGNLLSALGQAGLGIDLQGAVLDALDSDLVQVGLTIDECPSPEYALVSLVRGVELDRAYDPPRMIGVDVTSFASVATTALPTLATDGTSQFPVAQLLHPSVDEWIDAYELGVVVEELSDAGLSGRLSAGLDGDRVFATVTTAFTRKFADRIAESGPCTPEACDPLVRDLLGVFDDDEDGEVTLEEVRTNSLVMTLLRADLDTDDDGEEDAFTVGVRFHAEPVELYVN